LVRALEISRKEKYFNNTKTTVIERKNGKLLAIIFVACFYIFPI
jgi:hypothetical protein